jgi:SAM-dependent methyltransferase
MKEALLGRSAAPVVLVVGGGIMGKGMRTLAGVPAIRLINIDPSPGSEAVIFCDAHDVPFKDGTVDAVVTQAVLEHVADPVRCVEEIHRVLKPDGIVYSEIPFMQQVHQYGYDFTRFSHLGHRRLFRRFVEMESGAVAGPGTALAWAWRYFLSSLTRSPLGAKILFWVGRVTGMLVEQTDYFFRQRPGALDAASCIYFLGTRGEGMISDKDLVAAYRGAQRNTG